MTEGARLGRMRNPVRGFLHGSAAVVSVIGVIALLLRSGGLALTVTAAVYGLALVCMYVTSAMYHSIPWGPRWKARMQTLDHIFIYALVAGTFTPLLTAATDGPWLVLGLVGIWVLAALGLLREFTTGSLRKATIPLQFVAGSLVLVPTLMMLIGFDPTVSVLVVAGSAAYILGAWLFVNDRPRLVSGVFSHHEFFHVVVVAASVAHFFAVWNVVDLA